MASAAPLVAQAPYQTFDRLEGKNLNSFLREGQVAAHVVLRSGTEPRLIVAFPAGNSGVGLWFDTLAQPADWRMVVPPRPTTVRDDSGRELNGVTFTASIRAPRLHIRQAVLSSIRVLRDYQALGTAPAEVLTPVKTQDGTLIWGRDRLDGAPGYKLVVKPVRGRLSGDTIVAGSDGLTTLEFTALTGEKPLTPVAGAALLNAKAAADLQVRQALEFLSYREKYLAGSWRFDTYFGRDTLMSVRLLMPALQPGAVETGLRSVIERLSPAGEVAHEEDIGEFAILDHRKMDGSNSDAPVYDYKMIDGDFLLAPVARAWLVDDPRGRARATAFLAEREGSTTVGARLMTNLRFVVDRATPFARDPELKHLIGLKPGIPVGEWRDSNDGLGGGRYPYDVNAALVPAALDAARALYEAGLLAPYLKSGDNAAFDALPHTLRIWREQAPGFFARTVTSADARAAITAYADKAGVPVKPALQALGTAPVRYNAIALDGDGSPVPIMHSDEGFALLFGHPSEAQLSTAIETITRPFPAGLMTGAGMLVANPVFAPPALQAKFDSNAYHGTVIWSWQQALAAAGLARQLQRRDLSAATLASLRNAQTCLWRAIDAGKSMQNSELWSWTYADGHYRIVPFGASGADVDESNAAQLWSTVYLALPHPPADPAAHCAAS
ncbi:MAG TPA: hypothetical protein VFT56_10410 [Sphingomonas sp.]|nr:hypothetical protein [Sphingomonas sp.]